MKKKIFAVSTAALTAMALIPTAVSFAEEAEEEGTVTVTFNFTGNTDFTHIHDWSPDAKDDGFGAFSSSFTVDLKVSELSTYGMLAVKTSDGEAPDDTWSNKVNQTANVTVPAVEGEVEAGDTVTVAVNVTEETNGDGNFVVETSATLTKGSSDDGEEDSDGDTPTPTTPTTPADSTPSTITADKDVPDTGVAGVAAVVGVVAVAAGAMIVAKKRK